LRAKSAIEVPSKRIILDIPKPQLRNIFDRLEKLGAESSNSKTVEQTEIRTRPKTCIETSRKQTSRPKTPNVVQVNNQGKYPILSSNELKTERRVDVQRESRSKTCMELNHKDNRFKSARNLKSKSAQYRPKSVLAASNFHLNYEDSSRFASNHASSNNFIPNNSATATRSTLNELVVNDDSLSNQQTNVQKPCCRVVDGHWKHELLNRE
jgi:predicted peptidase